MLNQFFAPFVVFLAFVSGAPANAQQDTPPQSASAAPELVIAEAWVRALPPTQSNTAAYMRLSNVGQQSLSVVSGSSPIAGRVEIHTTIEVDGMLRMQQLPQLVIGAGAEASLSPGGAHLMLLELKRMPAPGESVPLCLQLAAGGEVCTVASVQKGDASSGAHHHHH